MKKRKFKRPITQAEFQDFLERIQLKAVREKGDHGNKFFGTLDGVPVILCFDFLSLTGYLSSRIRKATRGRKPQATDSTSPVKKTA